MDTVNPLKRPLPVPSDPLKLLVCSNCKKDNNVVLNLKTCGCLFCNSCDGDTRDICVSCQSKIDPKIKLAFLINLKCKFYEINKCYNIAEYKCKCIQNCFVCGSCLNFIHEKRMSGCCVPEVLRPKVTTNREPCQLCKEFIAEFKLISEPFTKICFNCKINKKAMCTQYEKKSETDSIWHQFNSDFVQSSQFACDNIKQLKEVLEASSLVRDQEIKKCKDAISEIQKCLDEYTQQYDQQILTLKRQLDSFNKILKILSPDGKVKTILDSLQNEKLTLFGEQGKVQIINFFKYYREKNNYNPVTEQIKRFVIQKNCSRTHILKFPLSSTSISDVSTDSDTSVQEIIDNGVKTFIIVVEMPTSANERECILEKIEEHRDKWLRTTDFRVNSKVIIFDADATDTHKYKRAKISKKGLKTSEVFLLDFGFEITVKNSSIGEINEIDIDGKKSCFLAQLTGNVDVKCGIEQESSISQIIRTGDTFELPKAQHIHFLD
ncbi:uncharacterized protein LOC107360260 [Tetranychus urticae]|uniref:Uncharacterized protein n=1 Tax=Tetranychus urticae TaxID=32264 RepID=T1K5I9_TETUR|nr:uncharacterized protein LOC107360260 [Tetranychus urticae]